MIKRITFILMIIFPCLFVAGCFEKDAPTIENTIVAVTNQAYEYNKETNTIYIPYDTISDINFTKDDFTLTVTYSDGLSETLDKNKYSLVLSCNLSQMKPNSDYTINFIDIESEKTLTRVNIKTGFIYINTITFEDNLSILYTGETLSIIDKLDEIQPSEDKKVSELIQQGALVVAYGSTSNAKVYNAHGYRLNLALANGYLWQDGSNDSITINWNIERIKIPIPEINTEPIYLYDIINGEVVGREQIVSPEFGDLDRYIQYSGIRIGTDAFQYRKSFWISVKSQFQGSHILYDEKTQTEYPTGYEVLWKINPAPLPAITLKNKDFTFEKPSVDIVGTSKSNLNNFDENFIEFDYSHSDPFTVTAGEGSIRFKIKQKYANNFIFAPSTDDSIEVFGSYMDINYFVKKGTFVPNSEINNDRLKIEISYFNSITPASARLIKTSSASVIDWTDDSWNYLIEQGLVKDNLTDGFYFEWGQNFEQEFNAGNYENLKLIYHHHNQNYNPIELEVDLTINKAAMNFTTVNLVQNELTDGKTTYTALSAEVAFNKNFENRLKNLTAYGMEINYILEYKQTDSSTPTTYKVSTDSYTDTYFNNYMINAGKYSLMAEISCNGNYSLSVDGGEQTNLAYVKYNFEIEKFNTSLTVKEVENNLTSTNSFYETNDNNFYYKQGQSINLTLTDWKEDNKSTSYILYRINTQNQTNLTTLVKSFTFKTYYRENEQEDWVEAENTTDVGYYKNTYTFSPISDNISINDCDYSWRIHSGVIHFETNNLTWAEYKNVRYDAKAHSGAQIGNLPENIFKVKYYNYIYPGAQEEPVTPINVNTYTTKMHVVVPNDGSITFTYPDGMFTPQEKGSTIEYSFSKQTFWTIYKYYLNPIEFKYELVEDTFVFDDKVDHKIEYKLNILGETEFDKQLLAFLNRAVFVKNYEAKPQGSYEAQLQLAISADDDNFDYNYEEFKKAGYIYDEANSTLTLKLPWKIISD